MIRCCLLLLSVVWARALFPQSARFELLSAEKTGIQFINTLPEDRHRNIIAYHYYYNGGGVAAADFDNDGLTDLFFTGNLAPNKIYRNLGDFQFEDRTENSGIQNPSTASWCTGVVCADVNQDGLMDLYVCRSGNLLPDNRRNLLFINLGNFQFREAAADYGLADPGYSLHAAFFDYDRDGDLDLYLANHGFEFFEEKDIPRLRTARHPYSGDKLFENRGGKFVDVTERAGIKSTAFGYGLGVSIADLNRDGWDDIFVSNDFFEHDYLYYNNGDGTFRESIKTATRHISNFSMGNDIADYNRDGWPDIMVLDMVAEDNRRLKANMSGMDPAAFWTFVDKGYHYQYMFNTQHLNRGNETFSEVAHLAGVSNTDWSWAPLFADLDNDGWLDLQVTNGLRKDARNTDFRNQFKARLEEADAAGRALSDAEWKYHLSRMPAEKIKNYVFRNQGDLTFEKVTDSWGMGHPSWSNGAVYADLNNDGLLDLVISNIDEPPSVYRNRGGSDPANWLRIQFNGPEGNRLGIGTKAALRTGDTWQYLQLHLSRGYQSSVEPVLHFGLGSRLYADEIRITWPDGRETRLGKTAANQTLTLGPKAAKPARPAPKPQPTLFLKTQVPGLAFQHQANAFDDFAREVLLPHKMSEAGPCLAVGDVNGDGRDDVFVGGARGQSGVLFLQTAQGEFAASAQTFDPDGEDAGAALFDADGDGDLDLYVASGGNEAPPSDTSYLDRLYLNDGKGGFVRSERLPAIAGSSSCVVPFDFDGDGDLDLFVGGRQAPGEYPMPGRSMLLRNDGGWFTDVTFALAPGLAAAGMVTSAVWVDVNEDGLPDLVIAGEWMAITAWIQHKGLFQPQALAPETEGWWFSLHTADLDGDGDLDLLAGNLGYNYKYKASPDAPFEVFSDDFDQNGSRDIVLSYYQDVKAFPLRGRSCSSQQIPELKKRFPTYSSFAEATLQEVYAEAGLSRALHYRVVEFGSVWLENRGDGLWEKRVLPPMAQLSAVNGLLVQDFDGDGLPDVLLAGNLYGSEVETPRADASVGLLLLGDGKGGLSAVDTPVSGFFAPGDVKALHLIDVGSKRYVLVGNHDGPLETFELRRVR